jgi:HD-GYP domain-containing protein (c-di-GMP phosphodiesterase class II)
LVLLEDFLMPEDQQPTTAPAQQSTVNTPPKPKPPSPPMAAKSPKSGKSGHELESIDPGEALALLLLRLPQLVKLHQPNNKLFRENIKLFQDSLSLLWSKNETTVLRLYRGRLFINETRLTPSQALLMTVNKLIETLESRGFLGFKFQHVDPLTDEAIVEFIKEYNASINQPEPAVWLSGRLADSWATPIVDTDFKISIILTDDGTGRTRPLIWNPGVQTLAFKAKKSYSRALSAISSLNDNISDGQSTSISGPKRVVQDIVEGLFENESLLLSLSTIRDYDDYTCTHSVNVAILSMCLGKRLGLGKVSIMTLGLAALFHDLGKVDIPINLIRKTTKFTDDEFEVVKNHTIYSVLRVLKINAEHNLKSRLIVPPFEHHLGVDLTGYPPTGRQSPLTLYGRIVAICDHYDALTSSRSYRPDPISPEQALDIMLHLSGTELDPLLLKVFINMIGIYPVGTLLLLDSHEVAIVSETLPSAVEGRPMCYLLKFENNEINRGDYIDLSERNENGRFLRNILRCFHPTEFGLNPTEILI